MSWVFFVGGPRALKGTHWWCTQTPHGLTTGCIVARDAGARIPRSAYRGPLRYHQMRYRQIQDRLPPAKARGASDTAILPLEV